MRFSTLLIFLLLTLNPLHGEILSMENIAAHIQKGVQTRITGQNRSIIQDIYAQTGDKPLWIGDKNRIRTSHLIQALNDPLFNYKNKSFDQRSIKHLFYQLDNGEISQAKQASTYAKLDLVLTSSFVRLVRFIVQGDVDWNLVQEKLNSLKKSDDIAARWEMEPKAFPDLDELISAIENDTIYEYLTTLLPMEKRYRQLVKLLNDYRRMDKFPKIKYSNETLKLGDRSSRVEEIKKRLQITGDYPKNAPIDSKFDEALKKAVMTYQKRYLIKVSGIVDRTTTYYLNLPAKSNIQAIITNLDKTKLYPKQFEDEYIEVNIPDFNLRYYKDHEMIMKKGIVVGRIDRPTPLFSNAIRYMVLNPTWTITDNLVKRDLIPVLRENPMYLEENNIHAFQGKKEIQVTPEMLDPYEKSEERVPYRFVQFPGDNNALGRVKFMFPNKYDVYLHDTDNKSLLSRRYKIYSSGCMRLEKPFDLVSLLLEHVRKSYSQSEIEEILESNKPTTIGLKQTVPIHMVYFTVYEEDGLAYFKNDIYLYDKIIEESVVGNKKSTFTVPKKRMISVKKNAKPLSN
ncbi:murein L,D-transpeptidase [Sulfurovum sp. TSL1]|uniref:L,D-transpeptidase family protein n=1 Tax=Sulfurovum sp. TSL1 TaxID=2826994 RepID=UPI001CC7547A|nr:L,D-transpeptidase family protein [Sulfurovum sp. TSL1]GIT98886.1 peptidoglycan-binding protein [Sulfurovum sp. TSL1]